MSSHLGRYAGGLLAIGLLIVSQPSLAFTDDDAPLVVRAGAVAAYDLPGKARWNGDDLAQYLENPFPLGAGAMGEVRWRRTRVSYTWFTSRNLQQAVPSLDLGGPLRGSFRSDGAMDMGFLRVVADGDFDLDARWALQGRGYRWRLGRHLGRLGDGLLSLRLDTHADVFGFDMRVDLDGELRGQAEVHTSFAGLPLVWTTETQASSMEGRVDLVARGVTLGLVPALVLEPFSWLVLELGPRLELKTLGIEYEVRMGDASTQLPDIVQLGNMHRSSKIGYHVRFVLGPLWIEGNDDSGFADEWSTGLQFGFGD